MGGYFPVSRRGGVVRPEYPELARVNHHSHLLKYAIYNHKTNKETIWIPVTCWYKIAIATYPIFFSRIMHVKLHSFSVYKLIEHVIFFVKITKKLYIFTSRSA